MNETIQYDRDGDYVKKETYTPTGLNDPAVNPKWSPYYHLHITLSSTELNNNKTDVVGVTINVVDGLEVVRGNYPANATVLNYDGDVTLSVDGQQTTKTLTNGSVEFDITTDMQAGSEIEIIAESLDDHPAESDSAAIEVVSQ